MLAVAWLSVPMVRLSRREW